MGEPQWAFVEWMIWKVKNIPLQRPWKPHHCHGTQICSCGSEKSCEMRSCPLNVFLSALRTLSNAIFSSPLHCCCYLFTFQMRPILHRRWDFGRDFNGGESQVPQCSDFSIESPESENPPGPGVSLGMVGHSRKTRRSWLADMLTPRQRSFEFPLKFGLIDSVRFR